MKDKHVSDLLSSYLDGAVTDGERRRVDAHAAKCAACRKELNDLEKVRALVASLPKEPLPGGFMQRLAARRRREESAGPVRLPAFLPARTLALGLTGVLACLFFFREIKYRLAPSMLAGMDSADSVMDSKMEQELGYAPSGAVRGLAEEKGGWSGIVKDAAPAAQMPGKAADESRVNKETLAMLHAASAGKSISRKTAPAETPPPAEGVTNESLRGFLDKESRKMGIREVLPPQAASAAPEAEDESAGVWNGIPNRPMTREEARTAMRQMTQNLYQINQQSKWKRAPTVPLTGRTPKLIAQADSSGSALNQPEPAPAPSESLGARSVAFAKVAARSGAPVGAVSDRMISAPAMRPVLETSAPAMPASAPESARAPKTLDWTREWSSATGGMPAAGGAVIRKPEDWADMHGRVGFAPDLPPFDPEAEMAVAVFGEPSSLQNRTVRIVSVAEENGRLFIRYRTSIADDGKPSPSAPYHIVIVPRSDLPFSFLQVP